MSHSTQPLIRGMLLAIGIMLAGCSTQSQAPESHENEASDNQNSPIRALLITGGGWHDYETQETLLTEGLNARIPELEWTIIREGDGEPDHHVSRLQQPDWTDGFDVVVHNTGFGRVEDAEFVEQFVRHHRGTPAVLIHSAVHSYRYAEPSTAWFEFSGVQSMWHEPERPLQVDNIAPGHPVMANFPARWPTPVAEELYVVEKVWGDITPLATIEGTETEQSHPVIWTHEAADTRVFATTLGHHNKMHAQPEFLDMVARGLLWALMDGDAGL